MLRFVLSGLLLGAFVAQAQEITHGPILGRLGSTEIGVWARTKRPGETEGQDYFFVDREEFGIRINQGYFLEHAKVFDHYYGTPRGPVEAALAAGQDMLFDIDWQGTQ